MLQAKVEIAAKTPGRDLLLEIAVGGRDDPHIDGPPLHLTQTLHRAALEHPEELPLNVERELPNLVEEDGAAACLLERTTSIERASVGAPHRPEEHGLGDVLGHGRAVDDDEGARSASRSVMDRARDVLFAGTGLSEDQHREIAQRQTGDHLMELDHRRIGDDDLVAGVLEANARRRRR